MSTTSESRFTAWLDDPEYPEPSPEDLERPEFQAIWGAIRGWDLSRRRPDTESARLYSGASGSEVMHILLALSSIPTVDQVRENIRAYLQYVADVEVGTVLSPASREIVEFCAEWVRNRLDEKWLKDKVVPLARVAKGSKDVEPENLTERALSGLLTAEARGRTEAEDTVEAIRADLEEERKYRYRAEAKLEAVQTVVRQYNNPGNETFGSLTAMQRITTLLATPAVGGSNG